MADAPTPATVEQQLEQIAARVQTIETWIARQQAEQAADVLAELDAIQDLLLLMRRLTRTKLTRMMTACGPPRRTADD